MKATLREIGFDEKEADIYLALLKQESTSVTELLDYTQIERRTIYDVLERLVQQGRASYFEENKTRKYLATKPEVLLAELKQKQDHFQAIIPELQQLIVSPKQAKVELLKGVKGLMTIFHEIIEEEQDFYSFGEFRQLLENHKTTIKQFSKNCKKKNIKEKNLVSEGNSPVQISGGAYKVLQKMQSPQLPTIVYENTVLQFIYTDPITIIKITSKEVAATHRNYFEHFWKLAKKI